MCENAFFTKSHPHTFSTVYFGTTERIPGSKSENANKIELFARRLQFTTYVLFHHTPRRHSSEKWKCVFFTKSRTHPFSRSYFGPTEGIPVSKCEKANKIELFARRSQCTTYALGTPPPHVLLRYLTHIVLHTKCP